MIRAPIKCLITSMSVPLRSRLSTKACLAMRSSLNLNKVIRFYFCQKNHEAGKKSEAENKYQQAQISERTFEELCKSGDEDSIIQVHRRLVELQERTVKYSEQISDLKKNFELLQTHTKDNIQKENLLKENIKNQHEQILRIEKRVQKQIKDSKDFAVTKLAKQLLQVADCISRCKAHAQQMFPQQKDRDQYVSMLIEAKQIMVQTMAKYEIAEFDPTGKPYDPNAQQSLLEIPCIPGYTAGTVGTTMQTGYTIKGRLLRHARVGVFS